MHRFLVLLLLVSGCATSGPEFRGAVTRRVSVDNATFQVRHTWFRAEAVRLNFDTRRGALQRGYRAIQIASGCEIIPGTFHGDPARMEAALFCPR